MNEDTIIMTWTDHAKLTLLVESRRRNRHSMDAQAFERLAGQLARARLVDSQDIPPDVVTMNSRLRVRDLDAGDAFTFTLSWPGQADASQSRVKVNVPRVNVLAPLGMALLGCRRDQEVEWSVPSGLRRLRVEEVLFQPENCTPPEAC